MQRFKKITLAEIAAYLSLISIVIFILVPQIHKAKEGLDRDRKREALFSALPEPVSLNTNFPIILDNNGKIVEVHEQKVENKVYYLFFYENNFEVIEK